MADNNGSGPSAGQNLGQAINCANFITMIAMGLAVVTQAGSSVLQDREIRWSEGFIVAAMVFGVGRAIAVSRAVGAGLGRHVSRLSTSQIDAIEKSLYASDFLYVVALAMTRFATLTFVSHLSRSKGNRLVSRSLILLNSIWLVIGLFGVAFQCTGPGSESWSLFSPRCFDQTAFWSALEAIAMLITLATLGAIVSILWSLHVGRMKKMYVIFSFSTRLIELPIDILRLVYLSQAYDRTTDTDPTFDSFASVVTTAVFTNTAITLATLPLLLKYIRQLSAGNSLELNEYHTPPSLPPSSRRPSPASYRTDLEEIEAVEVGIPSDGKR